MASIPKPDDEDSEENDHEKEPTDVSYIKGKKGVPEFWKRAMEQNKFVWDTISEKDK